LEKLAGYLAKWGYIGGFLILVSLTLFTLLNIWIKDDLHLVTLTTLLSILDIFTTAVAIVIVAIPEGLPLAVSISMAFSVDTMKKDNLLVKKIRACEQLGFIKEICTGKTATLTKNDMHVKKFFYGFSHYDNNGRTLDELSEGMRDLLVNCIVLNNDARVEMSIDARYVPDGNGTEVAMLRFLQENEVPVHDLVIEKQRKSEFECQIPFNSERKRQTTVTRPYKGCDYVRIVMKGAPEYVMRFCTKSINQYGEESDLDQHEKARILQDEIIGNYARAGLRTFAYAYKDIDSDHWEDLQANNNNFISEKDRFIVERDLTFVAAFGINDDLREGIDKAIGKLKLAGINTRMVSGDNIETAIVQATKAGILVPGEEKAEMRCMTGE